jgi:hypothetical protein
MNTPSNTLVETELRGMLEAAGGNYAAAYDTIVAAADTTTRTAQIVNRSTRVERFKEAVASSDRGVLARANKVFQGYLPLVRKNAALAADEPRQLSIVEAKNLMEEALSIAEARSVLDARWETIKEHAFGHMTESFAAEGDEYPEHTPGSIDVPELGKRFAREGCGRQEPELIEKALRALVGPKVWEAITDRETVVVETVSIPKLMAMATGDPSLLEHLRRSLKVGEWKKPRLNVRDM